MALDVAETLRKAGLDARAAVDLREDDSKKVVSDFEASAFQIVRTNWHSTDLMGLTNLTLINLALH